MAHSDGLNAEDVANLVANMQRIAPTPREQIEPFLSRAQLCELKPEQHLLCAGDVATHSGILLRGLLREYFVMRDGTERTKAFVQAGQPTGSLADLLSNQPSRAFIVAHEPSRLLLFNFAELRASADQTLGLATWYVRLLEGMFAAKAEREYELLGLDAQARYARFAQRFPGLEKRVAARHVASYLGITPVHLSRLRRNSRDLSK